MSAEILTMRKAVTYDKAILTPCNNCALNPSICGNQYEAEIPGKKSWVMCKVKGPVERVGIQVQEGLAVISA